MKKLLWKLTLFINIILSPNVFASNWVIKAKNWFDGEVFHLNESIYILIKDEYIKELCSVKCWKGDLELVDIGEGVLLPALIDGHTHLLLSDNSLGQNFHQTLLEMDKLSSKKRLELGKRNRESMEEFGFQGSLDLGNSGYFLDQKLKGESSDYLMLASGPGIASKLGQYKKKSSNQKEYTLINKQTDLKKLINLYVKAGVQFLKIYLDNDPGDGGLSEEEVRSLKVLSDKYQLPIMAHTTTDRSLQKGLRAGIRNFHHVFEVSPKSLKMISESDTQVLFVPTFLGPKLSTLIHEDRDKTLKINIFKKKVKNLNIAFGSDTYYNLAKFSRGKQAIDSLYSYKRFGLKNAELLRSATSAWDSFFQNYGYKVGRIKPGYLANLLVVGDDLQRNINSLEKIKIRIKRGKR